MDRVEQNILECTDRDNAFDWETYEYLCSLADYWESEE